MQARQAQEAGVERVSEGLMHHVFAVHLQELAHESFHLALLLVVLLRLGFDLRLQVSYLYGEPKVRIWPSASRRGSSMEDPPCRVQNW